MKILLSAWNGLEVGEKKNVYRLTLLILSAAIMESAGIGLAMPFLAILIDQQLVLKWVAFYGMETIENVNLLKQMLYMAFVFAIILSCILRITVIYTQTKLANNIGIALAKKILQNILSKNFIEIDQIKIDEIILTLIGRINTATYGVLLSAINMLSGFILLILVSVGLIYLYAEQVFMVAGATAFIYLAITKYSQKRAIKDGELNTKLEQLQIKIINEAKLGVRDVKINALEERVVEEYINVDKKLKMTKLKLVMSAAYPRPLLEAVFILLIVFMAFMNRGEADSKEFILMLGVLSMSAQRLLPVIHQIYSGYLNVQSSLAALLYVYKEENIEIKIKKEERNHSIKFENNIELRDVEYGHDSKKNQIKGANLKICKGQWVGLTGPSGSGKTTLQDIMMGLLFPAQGGVYVDNQKITKENVNGWHKNIAHVAQDIFISSNTIRYNLTLGLDEKMVTDEDLYVATRVACLDQVLQEKAGGLDYFLNSAGREISGGQKQRIAIARALLKNRKVLFLDEATSGLDEATQNKILMGIKEKYTELTVIMNSHDKNCLSMCDKVVSMDELTKGRYV